MGNFFTPVLFVLVWKLVEASKTYQLTCPRLEAMIVWWKVNPQTHFQNNNCKWFHMDYQKNQQLCHVSYICEMCAISWWYSICKKKKNTTRNKTHVYIVFLWDIFFTFNWFVCMKCRLKKIYAKKAWSRISNYIILDHFALFNMSKII